MSPEYNRADPLLETPFHEEACTKHLRMDQIDPNEPVLRRSIYRRESFLVQFATSKGPPQIVLLILLLALGFGSTIGVVPAVVADRYARLNHGFDADQNCADFGRGDKPLECLNGSADAQNAAAFANLVSSTLTFITSSVVGSISDEKGRKGVMLIGIFLSTLTPLCLVLLQLIPTMSPTWYYSANAMTGLVNWIAVALSALSDVMPPKWRAASFGMILAGFSLGFALAPMLALMLDHFHVSLLSLSMITIGFFNTVVFFPETLPPETAAESARCRALELQTVGTGWRRAFWTVQRPVRELSILNRNKLFRLLSSLAFFSGMVTSGDQTLLIYYVEERLDFNDHDIAIMFMLMGILGILVQGVFLKPINDCLGERLVIVFAFVVGALDNTLYGLAKNKITIFIAIGLSAFCGMAFPTISAIKANNVAENEQGRIQGALYSVQALASGAGPLVLRAVYSQTKEMPYPGPGTMFIFAGLLFLVAASFAFALPKEKANSRNTRDEYDEVDSDHEEIAGSLLL